MSLESDTLSLLHAGLDQSIALVTPEPEISVTYSSLRQQVIKMAGELRALDVRPGIRVALPCTSTGKIQRRLLTTAFVNGNLTKKSAASSGVLPTSHG